MRVHSARFVRLMDALSRMLAGLGAREVNAVRCGLTPCVVHRCCSSATGRRAIIAVGGPRRNRINVIAQIIHFPRALVLVAR